MWCRCSVTELCSVRCLGHVACRAVRPRTQARRVSRGQCGGGQRCSRVPPGPPGAWLPWSDLSWGSGPTVSREQRFLRPGNARFGGVLCRDVCVALAPSASPFNQSLLFSHRELQVSARRVTVLAVPPLGLVPLFPGRGWRRPPAGRVWPWLACEDHPLPPHPSHGPSILSL